MQQKHIKELQEYNEFFDNFSRQIGLKAKISANVIFSESSKNQKYMKGQSISSKESQRFERKKSFLSNSKENKKASEEGESDEDDETNEEDPNFPIVSDDSTGEDENNESTVGKTSPASGIVDLRERFNTKFDEIKSKRTQKRQNEEKEPRRRERKKQKTEKRPKSSSAAAPQIDIQINEQTQQSSETTAADDLTNIDYGKISGLKPNEPYYKDNKSLYNMNKKKKKSLNKLLKESLDKKQHLQDLKSSTDESKRAEAKKLTWISTFQEASGEKVQNDPSKIKRKIKQKEEKKAKSRREWKARMDAMDEKKGERQKIRNHNLNQRKLGGTKGANLSKKRIKEDDTNDED